MGVETLLVASELMRPLQPALDIDIRKLWNTLEVMKQVKASATQKYIAIAAIGLSSPNFFRTAYKTKRLL